MLYKFKSRATPDLIMLEADARRLLQIMTGKSEKKGILTWSQMLHALGRLEAAIAMDEQERRTQRQNGAAKAEGSDPEEAQDRSVRLAQRAQPMVQVLKRCHKEESDLVWGV